MQNYILNVFSELFIIFTDTQECVSSPTTDQAVATTIPGNSPEEICLLKAHRVIVAARCDWFRRALLSGMREAIDR